MGHTTLHADGAPIVCNKIIQAHTLQRSELSKSARNGKVYGIKGDFITRMKPAESGDRVNRASQHFNTLWLLRNA